MRRANSKRIHSCQSMPRQSIDSDNVVRIHYQVQCQAHRQQQSKHFCYHPLPFVTTQFKPSMALVAIKSRKYPLLCSPRMFDQLLVGRVCSLACAAVFFFSLLSFAFAFFFATLIPHDYDPTTTKKRRTFLTALHSGFERAFKIVKVRDVPFFPFLHTFARINRMGAWRSTFHGGSISFLLRWLALISDGLMLPPEPRPALRTAPSRGGKPKIDQGRRKTTS